MNFWEFSTVAVVAAAIVAAIIVPTLSYNQAQTTRIQYAMDHGYSQQTVLGQTGVYWVKDNETLAD